MKYTVRIASLTAFIFMISACSTSKKAIHTSQSMDDGKIQIAILQMNDVYEIAGVDGGKVGGLSKVAHYYKGMKQKYPQSMMVLAGDFLNPSLIGTMKYEGSRIRGRQMVEVLNAMGLDAVAFGNHEFDVPEEDLQKRINESNFDWLATNLAQICGSREYPFYKEIKGKKEFLPESKVYYFKDNDGTELKLGMFSATINSNPVSFVNYLKADSCAEVEIASLKGEADIIVGLTHLTITEDMAFAKDHQEVALIMGGHEHDHIYQKVGETVVAKADANAKTVYQHILTFDRATGQTNVTSTLIDIDETIAKDADVDQLITKWNGILNTEIKKVFPNPNEVIYHAEEPLDGKETTTRHRQCNMGEIFASSVKKASRQNAQIGMLNSGSIRIDDELQGDILALDIFRALPFGGSIFDVKMKGSLLFGVLRFSENAKGTGAYLQLTGVEKEGDTWLVGGKPLDQKAEYTVALTDFLMKGLDIPFLNEQNEGIVSVDKPSQNDLDDIRWDVRKAIIDFMKGQ